MDWRVLQRLRDFAQGDHSYVGTRQERGIYDRKWKISLKSQGFVIQIRSRADFLCKFTNVSWSETGSSRRLTPIHSHHSTRDHAVTGKSDQATNSAEQSVARLVDPKTRWIRWTSSTSWLSSSTSWWPSTGWQEWWVHFKLFLFFIEVAYKQKRFHCKRREV